MTAETKCPLCGMAGFTDAMDGLCPRCLGRLAFAPAPPDQEIDDLRRLGDYELLEEIARGGMGVVYRARQLSLNRIVALKVVLNGPFSNREFIRRFQTEAEAAAALQHPNIVGIHEVGERDGTHFLSMEYVEGQSFAGLVRELPLPARRAAGYLHSIALAVQHAHERGVLHRDLKPSNILLDVFDQPRITDFGLAKLLNRDGELTVPGSVLGSPNYIPPEQAAGKFSEIAPPSDVYSLGAILYQLLTGRPPFQGETLNEILQQVQVATPVPPRKLNPSVPADLQTICLKCLQKEPARRYPTARALADDLESFLAGKPIRARPVSLAEIVWLWCKRHPGLVALWVALHLVLAAGLAGILYEWRQATMNALGETRQRLVAEHNAATTRLNLYAANVALAAQEMQQGDFGRARRTLERMIPQSGETDLRGFEWRYLWNLCRGNQLFTLGSHKWIVTSVAFASDGKTIASGGMGGQVKIWNAGKRECLRTLNVSTGAVWSLAFTSDNRALMIASVSGVQFHDLASDKILAGFPGKIATLSQDGTLVAISEGNPFFFEEAGNVSLWDWRTGRRLMTLASPGRTLALSPDGKCLAVATETTGIRLYETVSGKLLRTLPTKNSVWCLHFSSDGTELLSAGWAGEVSLWKTEADSTPRIFSANYLNVWDATFSPDGKTIATTSSDQTIHFWDHATLEQTEVLHGHESEVWCAAFSPDNQTIVTGGKDQKVMVWSAGVPVPLPALAHGDASLPLFSPDGTWLVTVNPEPVGAYSLWVVTNRTLVAQSFAHRHRIIGFSQDSKYVAAMTEDGRGVEFWLPQADQPARVVALQGLPTAVNEFIFWGMSPEGEFFFAVDRTGIVRVWHADTGALYQTIQAPPPPIRNAVLSAHGKFLAVSVERQKEFYLYDLAGGNHWLVPGHNDFASGLAFSPDSTVLATGSMDGTIRLWKTADAQLAGMLPGHLEETTDVAFSPDGQTLASIGQRESLKLWHLPTLREIFSQPLPHAAQHLVFSPDGRHLAVNTDEGKLLLLDAPE